MNEIKKAEEIANTKSEEITIDGIVKYAESITKLKEIFSQPKSSFVQTLLDIADTKFGYALGEYIGNHASEILSMTKSTKDGTIKEDVEENIKERLKERVKEEVMMEEPKSTIAIEKTFRFGLGCSSRIKNLSMYLGITESEVVEQCVLHPEEISKVYEAINNRNFIKERVESYTKLDK